MSSILKKISKQITFFLTQQQLPQLDYQLTKNKALKFGDYVCNIFLLLQQWAKKNQLTIDFNQLIVKLTDQLRCQEIAAIHYHPPGFLNFFLHPKVLEPLAQQIAKNPTKFGHQPKKNHLYYTELVSANPTGLLHLGHARNGVFGDTLNNLLVVGGYDVYREYLINDCGKQIELLATTIITHYLNFCGEQKPLQPDYYHGKEVVSCAKAFYQKHGKKYYHQLITKEDDPQLLALFAQFGVDYFLQEIKADLNAYQIKIDNWFSEKQMHNQGQLQVVFDLLKNDLYQAQGATWFQTSKYCDNEKDEVIIKSNKTTTYFAQDLSYHFYKLNHFPPKTTTLINIWGTDHYGHIKRLKAFLIALNYDPNKIIFLTTQLVRLLKDQKEVKISKRTGQTLTMRQMLSLVGYQPLRWYLVSQSIHNHIELDLNTITLNNSSNQIYYVLYAYARI